MFGVENKTNGPWSPPAAQEAWEKAQAALAEHWRHMDEFFLLVDRDAFDVSDSTQSTLATNSAASCDGS